MAKYLIPPDDSAYIDDAGRLQVKQGRIGMPYAAFSSSSDQTMLNASTAYAITYSDVDILSNDIYLSSNSRIYLVEAGVYLITYSAVGKSNLANKTLDIWLAVGGTPVDRSNTLSRFVGAANERIITVTYIYRFTAGQYFELMMHSDDTGTVLKAAAAASTPTRPASPSIIVTINMIAK